MATFRMPQWLRLVAIVYVSATALVAFALLVKSDVWGMFIFGPIALLGAFWLPRYTVRVRSDGVLLYGLRRLPWANVKAAKRRQVFGLPYVYVVIFDLDDTLCDYQAAKQRNRVLKLWMCVCGPIKGRSPSPNLKARINFRFREI